MNEIIKKYNMKRYYQKIFKLIQNSANQLNKRQTKIKTQKVQNTIQKNKECIMRVLYGQSLLIPIRDKTVNPN